MAVDQGEKYDIRAHLVATGRLLVMEMFLQYASTALVAKRLLNFPTERIEEKSDVNL